LDLGINNSSFSSGSWTVNGASDGYLYTSDSNLSIGVASSTKYLSLFAGGTLVTNEQIRVTTTGVGIGSTNPTSKLTVSGDASISGIVSVGNTIKSSGNLNLQSANKIWGFSTDGSLTFPSGVSIDTRNGPEFPLIVAPERSSISMVGYGTYDPGTNSVGRVNLVWQSELWENVTSTSKVSSLSVNGYGGKANVRIAVSTEGLNPESSKTWIFDEDGSTIFPGSVGITTTNPTSKLTVQGDVLVSGIVTATTFSGNATTSGYATTSGISTTSQGLTGTPNISVGVITATDYRIQSVAEKTTLVNGNTVSLVYNTGGGNIAICTNPSGDITLNVTGIPTDSAFDNYSLTFSVIVSNTGTARSCTTVNLNGVSRTIKWFGGSLSAAISGVTTTTGYDIYNFTGINTVGSASTATNYIVFGSVNGGYR
jgi:hypothetical protein